MPFALFQPDLVVQPITVEINNQNKEEIQLHSPNALMREGYLNASRWFQNVSNIWDINKTEKSKDMSSSDRIDFQNGIVQQDLNAPFLVLYNSSATNANSTIVLRKDMDLEFLVDHKAYWLGTESSDEAYYLTGILNSSIPNLLMKDF